MLTWLTGLWREISADRVTDMAAGLAYRFLLALFPFFIFMAALSGFISRAIGVEDPSGRIVDNLATALPSDAQSVLTSQLAQVLETSQPGLLSFGLVAALWSASAGLAAAMRAMNVAYDVEETRPWWRRTSLTLGLTFVGGAFVIGAFVVLVGAQFAREAIEGWFGTGEAVGIAVTVGRFAVAVALIALAAAVLYWLLPDADLEFRWISPGAVLFVLGWIAATVLFGWYVSNFASYNATYGTLGGLIVLMVWLYVTALMLLVGAEVNALIAKAETAPAPTGHEARTAPPAKAPTSSRPAATVYTGEVLPRSPRNTGLAATLTGAVVGLAALRRALMAPRGGGSNGRRPDLRDSASGRRESGFRSEGVSHG